MNNIYIGSRYVPKFCGDWNNIDSYDPLSIVIYGNNSYTSKRPVPTGTVPTNTNYWALTGNYNGMINHLEEEIEDIRNDGIVDCENPPSSLNPLIPDEDIDNTANLQSLVDYCATNNKILLMHGVYLVDGTVILPSEITILGTGGDFSNRDNEPALSVASTVIKRRGTNTSAIFESNSTERISGITINNIGINGNSVAQYGLKLNRVTNSQFDNISITDVTNTGLYLKPSESNIANDNIMFNEFKHIIIDRCYDGLYLGASTGGNCCYNLFESIRCDVTHTGGVFEGGDNNTFINLSCYQRGSSATAWCWYLNGSGFVSNVFVKLAGKPNAVNGSVNSVYEYDMENNEGLPSIDGNSKLFYTCNSRNGSGINNVYPIKNVTIPLSDCNGFDPSYNAVNDKFLLLQNGMVGMFCGVGLDSTNRRLSFKFSGDGSTPSKIIEFDSQHLYFDGHKITYTDSGTMNEGDILLNPSPVVNGYIGKVYISGSWHDFGKIE